jgi:hypothetical protein
MLWVFSKICRQRYNQWIRILVCWFSVHISNNNKHMKHLILERLFEDCKSHNPEDALKAMIDLKNLIKRHTGNKYEDNGFDNLFSHRNELVALRLEHNDIMQITYFLFYLLMNFPDRSANTARCLVKCYDKSIVEGICQAIEVYYLKCDETTCHLTDAITHIYPFDELNERVIILFRKLKNEGLPKTQKMMSAKFAYYKNFYGFVE